MKTLCFVVAFTGVVAADPLPPAPLDMRTGKHHALHFDVPTVAGAEPWLAVGADVAIGVPSRLGQGHGPFYSVYDAGHGIAVDARSPGLATHVAGETVTVRCLQAGTFELDVTATPTVGAPIHDAIDVRCAVPTRFTGKPYGPGRYIVGGRASVELAWFGRRLDGSEVQLVGALGVAVATGEHAVAVDGPWLHLLGPSTGLKLVSAGLTTTVPLEIVEPASWSVDIELSQPPSEPARVWAGVHLRDEHGELRGIGGDACAITSYLDGVPTARANNCRFPIVHRAQVADPHRHRRSGDWTADRICVSVLAHTSCVAVP